MHSTTLTENLIAIRRLRFVNCYLLREEDGFTLIDTTLSGAADELIEIAGAAGGEIRRITLTHGHGDHAGSLDALKAKLGDDAEVSIPELDARILAGEHIVDGKLPGSWPTVSTTPDVRLQAGDRVGSLEVIASPGHTPGHIAFLDTRDRSLIAGDSYTTLGSVAVPSHYYWRFPLAAMATWDKAVAVESATRLRDLDPTLLVAGHGPAVTSPRAAMDAALTRATSKLS
jgi:glyoxylase-like metal-dependent hydrolase (beta-lactamase superfamily II)